VFDLINSEDGFFLIRGPYFFFLLSFQICREFDREMGPENSIYLSSKSIEIEIVEGILCGLKFKIGSSIFHVLSI